MLKREEMKPDYARATIWQGTWSAAYPKFELRPGGFLLAVTIESATGILPASLGYFRAEFEFTDWNDAGLWGNIEWDYPQSCCGMAFEDPLPNMSARSTYWLKRVMPVENVPDLTVTLLHLAPHR